MAQILVDISKLMRALGGRTVIGNLSWTIQEGEKIGLIGPNGTGKSTLLRTIAGVDAPDGGQIVFRRGARVAYLAQEYAGEPARGALAELIAARDDIAAIEAQITAVEAQLGDPAVANDMRRLERALATHERLLAELDTLGANAVHSRAERLLRGMQLAEARWEVPMRLLSGGERKMVGLARCLLADPDLLLLDEPDNHLDMARKGLLEQLIREFAGAVVIISHDRYLLDETVRQIAELEPTRDGARIKLWEGNYSSYATQKELALLRQQADFKAQQQDIAHLEAAIARFKVWMSVSLDPRLKRQINNKQRQIDTMDKVERPVLERRKMALQLRPAVRGGAKAIELRRVDKVFGEQIILLDAQATIMNGERIGIVGPNGAGKTVLLRIMLGQLEPDSGELWCGPSITRDHYAQHHETLDFAKTPIAILRDLKPITEGEAVSKLGRFLIPYSSAVQPVATLSGGEKSRVQLALLMLGGANCLLLDEPTNNLDIPSAEVLEQALDSFGGTVIVVSHDRYFLDRVADRIFEVRDGELRVYEGGYSAFAEKRQSL